ncbi:cupin domain-containing protein [Mucilaginibacter litoreus]|uniref:Cupin domain-containing protein n=1 Tax=Mucilaginibacter litoreus TaxID=1048221 RepID=A0ABW3AW47_9SPHI
MSSSLNFLTHNAAKSIRINQISKRVILSKTCSGGKLTIYEHEVSVGLNSAIEICNDEDKVILVAEGKFVLYACEREYFAEKGSNILVPAGIKHHYKNIGTQTGKLLITLTPGGKERFLSGDVSRVKVYGKNTAAITAAANQLEVT